MIQEYEFLKMRHYARFLQIGSHISKQKPIDGLNIGDFIIYVCINFNVHV